MPHSIRKMSWPNILILTGGLLAVVGAFWASIEQANYERETNLKLEQTIHSITGGSSFGYVMPQLYGTEGYWIPAMTHSGSHTLYDVTARFTNVSIPPPYSNVNIEFGNIAKSSSSLKMDTRLPLPVDKRKQSFNVFISSRSGFFTQVLRMHVVDGAWRRAWKVTRDSDGKELYRFVDPQFPLLSGEPDWSE